MSLKYTVQLVILSRYQYFLILLGGILGSLPGYCFKKNDKIPAIINAKKAKVDGAPVFSTSNYSYTVSDTRTVGNAVGIISASDPNGGTVTYEIASGNTNNCFAVNSLTGLITVAKLLNHHTQSRYVLTVKARDMGGISSQASLTINVELGITTGGFDSIPWGTAANQAYTVNELQGEVVNGKLYTFGGFDSQKPGFTPTSRAYVFDPVDNTWTAIADMPPMNGTTHGGVTHAGFTNDGTNIYFAGGYTANAGGTGQIFGTKEAWKYIIAENRYERLPDLPITIAAGQLEYLAGKLHHISGTNASRTVDLGDHYVLDLDSLANGWKKLAPLPNPRQHAGSVVYEGKIYFIGGQHGQDAKLVAQKDVHSYDPVTDTWTKLADLPVPAGATGRGHISSAAIILGKYIIVLGGETVHATSRTNMVSAYTPETNTWKDLTPLPQSRYSGVGANLGGIIYYSGGSSSKGTYKGIPFIQKIQSLTLIDADTDQPLQILENGDTLNLASLATKNLNIRANTFPATVGSVVFSLSGAQAKVVTENIAPYAFYGDNMKGDYYSWTPVVGNYTLTCYPYGSSKGTGTQGSGVNLSFTVINKPTGTISLVPIADAYVRNGTYADINYGGDTTLQVKTSSTSDYNRQAYIKFSLNGISQVNSAKLRIYGGNIQSTASVTLSSYGLSDSDGWIEKTITFNNIHPLLTSALSSAIVNSEIKYYEFDVTNFVKSQFAGDKVAGFLIKDPGNKENIFSFNSRENSLNPPQLVIGYTTTLNETPSFSVSDSKVEPLISVKTYPNPARNVFNIEFSNRDNKNYKLQITDMAGRVYKLDNYEIQPGVNNLQVDVSKLFLSPGVYFLSVQQANNVTRLSRVLIE